HLEFDQNRIVSNMISLNREFQVLINMENDILNNGREKIELNLAVSKTTPRTLDETGGLCDCEIADNRFYIKVNDLETETIFTEKRGIAIMPSKMLADIISDDGLPDTENLCFFATKVTHELITRMQELKRDARRAGKIYYTIERHRLALKVIDRGDDNTVECQHQFIEEMPKEVNNIAVSFSGNNFKNLMDILTVENRPEYKIQFLYDPKTCIGSLHVISEDGSEQYILNGIREIEEATIEPLDLEAQYESTPEIPENWHYGESVEKVRTSGYKWKNLTKEIADELWIAKQILPKSHSEAAQIRHGSILPDMTWTQYCKDIGSSPQVVNRWLKRRFVDGDRSGGTGDNNDSEALYRETVKSVLGDEFTEPSSTDEDWIGPQFVSLSGRNAEKYVTKLLQEHENESVAEAIVNAKTQNMHKAWFRPLFDHLLCFVNQENENSVGNNCFIYLGQNKDKFIAEFSKFGIILTKA
ncbi:MAG: hypothetical protein JSW07_08885, partial [bacterium]